VAYLTGRSFFPHLIDGPFSNGLHEAFDFAIAAMLVAAAASWMRGKHAREPREPRERGFAPAPATAASAPGLNGSGEAAPADQAGHPHSYQYAAHDGNDGEHRSGAGTDVPAGESAGADGEAP
jgi:hypothetical protein